ALVDSVGTVRNNYRYDPFGQKLPSSSEQVANSFTFLGGFSVPTFGPYSLTTYRTYDSKSGRFTTADPARFNVPASPSAYLYAGQSPLAGIDVSGLATIAVGAELDIHAFVVGGSASAALVA